MRPFLPHTSSVHSRVSLRIPQPNPFECSIRACTQMPSVLHRTTSVSRRYWPRAMQGFHGRSSKSSEWTLCGTKACCMRACCAMQGYRHNSMCRCLPCNMRASCNDDPLTARVRSYPGAPHTFTMVFPETEVAARVERDVRNGLRWLLASHRPPRDSECLIL